jgi:hypothetical protein
VAADVPAPNTVQATIWYQLDVSGTDQDTRFWQNSLYFERISGVVDYDNATALGIALADWWGTEISPKLPERVLGREIRIYDLTTTKTLVQFHGLFLAPGTVPDGPLPLNCALRIEFLTDLPGRSGRGNNTISGIPFSFYFLNEVHELWATGIVAAYQLLLTLATDNGWTWVVCSRRADGADRAVALNTPIVDCEFADLHVDSWRGRLNHRGF